ncbi:hypothetical protein [Thermincola ferriacetica]|uniref:hypothetical protein n=1 Tax=Thermincola ferriacetica TaxID=281456 RepID=UPI00128BA931|nr:hypothetical protein [Thermincola ferriacetica]
MSEDGEGRGEVRHSTQVEWLDGRRPDPQEMHYEPSSSGTLPARQGFAAQSSRVAGIPSYPAAILQHKAPG